MFFSEVLTCVTVGFIEKGLLFPEKVYLLTEFALNQKILMNYHRIKDKKGIINSRLTRSVSKSYLPSKALFTSSNKDVTIMPIVKH